MTQNGRFLSRVVGEVRGNVLLRKEQYMVSESKEGSLAIAKNMITGKLFNTRWVIERATRNHPQRVDVVQLKIISDSLRKSILLVQETISLEQLRGFEGEAASQYFSLYDDLALQQKEDFHFTGRNRKPPLDNGKVKDGKHQLLKKNIIRIERYLFCRS